MCKASGELLYRGPGERACNAMRKRPDRQPRSLGELHSISERTLGPLIERRISSSSAYAALILMMLQENPHDENHDLEPVVVVGEEKYSHAYS